MPLRTEPWPGMRQDTTDLGQGVVDVLNVKYQVQGELERRPGLGTRYGIQATQLGYLSVTGGNYLVAAYTTTLKTLNMDTLASTTVKTSLTSARGSFASANGALYYANGTDSVQVMYDGTSTAGAAGIVAPTNAPTAGTPAAGSVTAGTHLIRFRWKNSVTGYYSNPSPSLSFTAAGSQNVPLTLDTTADSKVDKMVIEMTEASGSTFYVVATVADASSYTISVSDATLAQGELADVFSAPDGYGHEPPPATAKILLEHRNRIFYLTADGTLGWSRASYPEAFNALEWSQKVFSGGGDKAIAIGSFFGDLYVFGQRSMARFVYTGDPASGMLVQMPTKFGVWNQNCVVDVEGTLWGWGRQGVFRVSEIQPRYMSAPIARTLNNDQDFTYTDNNFAFFDPQERVVWFVYRGVDDTAAAGCRSAIAYDMQTGTWSRRSFRHRVTHAILAGDSVRDDFVYIADANGGYTWRLTDGVFDGVPDTMTSGVVSVTTGATTTVIPTTTAMDDVVGAIVYNPLTGEEVRVSSNTTYSMSVTPAFAAAPATGTELWIGSIPVLLRSQWDPMHYAFVGRRPDNMEIYHLSDTQGVEFEVRYYLDYSTTPTVWTKTADDAPMNGFSVVNGASYATQDVSHGKNHVPVPAEWMLCIQWRLDQNKPTGIMRLLNCSFTTRDQRTAQDVGH